MVTGFFTLDINLLKHAKCTSFNTEININAPELYNILHCDIKKKIYMIQLNNMRQQNPISNIYMWIKIASVFTFCGCQQAISCLYT